MRQACNSILSTIKRAFFGTPLKRCGVITYTWANGSSFDACIQHNLRIKAYLDLGTTKSWQSVSFTESRSERVLSPVSLESDRRSVSVNERFNQQEQVAD